MQKCTELSRLPKAAYHLKSLNVSIFYIARPVQPSTLALVQEGDTWLGDRVRLLCDSLPNQRTWLRESRHPALHPLRQHDDALGK